MNFRTLSTGKPSQEFLRFELSRYSDMHLAALACPALSVLPSSGRFAASHRYQFPWPTCSFRAVSIFPSCQARSRISLRMESKRPSAPLSSAIACFASVRSERTICFCIAQEPEDFCGAVATAPVRGQRFFRASASRFFRRASSSVEKFFGFPAAIFPSVCAALFIIGCLCHASLDNR